jgi:molybdopterin synthase catalytic subunit
MIEFILVSGAITDEHRIKTNNKNKNIGASAIFEGTVRADVIDEKEVVAIDFSMPTEITKELTLNILKKYSKQYKLKNAIIFHSIGKVKAGERCFRVLVESEHRKEAFQVIPVIVDEFKAKVPVFGKEIFKDDTYAWKQNK